MGKNTYIISSYMVRTILFNRIIDILGFDKKKLVNKSITQTHVSMSLTFFKNINF